MAAARPLHIVLKSKGLLINGNRLAIAAQCHRARDHNLRNIVVKGRHIHAHIRKIKSLLLQHINPLAVIAELGLIKQVGAEKVSVRQREVTETIAIEHRKSRRRRSAEVRGR